MKIYTRSGDTGHTDTLAGERLSKASDLMQAVGDIDELNATIGLALSAAHYQENSEIVEALTPAQHELFVIGAQISAAGSQNAGNLPEIVTPQTLARIETQIDLATKQVPELHSFIMPGGCELSSRLHICRTVCRRSERATVRLCALGQEIPQIIITYLNRLSDLLFILARLANHQAGQEDIFFTHD